MAVLALPAGVPVAAHSFICNAKLLTGYLKIRKGDASAAATQYKSTLASTFATSSPVRTRPHEHMRTQPHGA